MKCRLVSRRTEGAIRRIDVAIIIAAILVLVAFAIFSASRWRERALQARCGINLKQLGIALQIYSRDYKGLLPDVSRANPQLAGPTWPWDMHTNLTDLLMDRGATRATFYCPANPKMNDDSHWNFWEEVAPGAVRVTGYGMLFKGIKQVPQQLWCANLSGNGGRSPAETELGFDTTACVNNDYTAITGLLVDPSNHVRGKKPLGGNILFLDGHVQWRDFSKMQVRFNTVGPSGPVLWSF
jgi:prepilin-type processing-associated H-X9-DG protein